MGPENTQAYSHAYLYDPSINSFIHENGKPTIYRVIMHSAIQYCEIFNFPT